MAKDKLWAETPEKHDYPAALDYLSLLMSDAAAAALVAKFKTARLTHRKAKDILRASGLPILPRDNAHVARDLKKIRNGKKLSPVLLVRGDRNAGVPLAIADGYHRICASWHTDENALIPGRLV
ncbi:hypothetical protein [Rhizomicrobium electricum]|uniref:ParB/Sulfiredoxin domain-containing protein n=1 Tax=Rhizomicrobium electricum TaxID=480070 RepID=A0ABN1EJD5_9PROT|nr:hypothetical protein [Rhizomicrobium electricum]NIJ48394.1 hypothetical protein [Rhizomicrobium electricum]